jgi:hypothetical protein
VDKDLFTTLFSSVPHLAIKKIISSEKETAPMMSLKRRAHLTSLLFLGILAVEPVFAATTWLECTGTLDLLIKPRRTVPMERATYGFNESNHTVISNGQTFTADFNDVSVGWDEQGDDPYSTHRHYQVNRSTLELSLQVNQNGSIAAIGSGTCTKTAPPANNQF